jgi:hypothetical protein
MKPKNIFEFFIYLSNLKWNVDNLLASANPILFKFVEKSLIKLAPGAHSTLASQAGAHSSRRQPILSLR